MAPWKRNKKVAVHPCRALTRFFALFHEVRLMRNLTTHAMSRDAPGSIRSRDVLATFLLRFPGYPRHRSGLRG
jgi:hypothetical protein